MKPITSLSRGDLFMPSSNPTNVYTFCRESGNECFVRHVALLIDGTWHMTKDEVKGFPSDTEVAVVKALFLCEEDV